MPGIRPLQRNALILGLLACAGLIVWQATQLARDNALNGLHQAARQNLELYATHIEGELAKFEYLPALLSSQYELVRLLREPRNPYLLQRVNRFLELANGVAGASDTYLMDREGLTLAASNHASPLTFVDKNWRSPGIQAATTRLAPPRSSVATTSPTRCATRAKSWVSSPSSSASPRSSSNGPARSVSSSRPTPTG
jgi:two-component system C4-dicarboxylate transport sensor histidine kinase DctB